MKHNPENRLEEAVQGGAARRDARVSAQVTKKAGTRQQQADEAKPRRVPREGGAPGANRGS